MYQDVKCNKLFLIQIEGDGNDQVFRFLDDDYCDDDDEEEEMSDEDEGIDQQGQKRCLLMN